MTIITPARFPNKSGNSNLLLGTKYCNTSSKIDKNIKYKLKILNWLFFLKVKKPITERTMYAYKWFVEMIKSGVIWGCKLKSLAVPIVLNIGDEEDFKGIVDLVKNVAIVWHEENYGSTFDVIYIPEDLKAEAEKLRG